MKKLNLRDVLSYLIIAVLCLSFFGSALVGAEEAKKEHLVILGTSDIHSDIWGYIYEDDKESENSGAARLYSYIKEVREEYPELILIDNGDTYQGNILADAIYNKNAEVLHPMTKYLNFAEYDVLTLGNHEFNFGLDFLHRIIDELEIPVLAANIEYKEEVKDELKDKEFVEPYLVLERNGVKIGILGITNVNSPRWDGDKVADLNFYGIEETAAKYVPVLREEEGCDLVIASVHAGLQPEFDWDNYTDGAEAMINNVEGIDLVMLGHFHSEMAEEINGIPVGMPKNAGKQIVRFDVDMIEKDGAWAVDKAEVQVINMEDYEASEEVRELIKEEHQHTIDFIKGEGSAAGEEGGGIFGEASEDFQPENEILGLPEGKLQDTAVIDLIAKIQLEVSGADVTSVALFKDSSNIEKGPINYGTLFDIYKFDNTLYTVEITGKELKNYMEWSAQHYNTWKEGDISISFNEDVPGYLYDMFEGVEYEVDLSQEAGQRIKNVMFKGEPLKDEQKLSLAVNNYRYSSGLMANELISEKRNWESPQAIREYIGEYIQEKGTISPEVTNNWKIVGVELAHPLRDEIIKLVNDGVLDVPYFESLNIQALEEAGVIVDGKVVAPAEK